MSSGDDDFAKRTGAPRVKVAKDGPYIVTGGVPLVEMTMVDDEEGVPCAWEDGKRFPSKRTYILCRCGGSDRKPFCDGTHAKIGFVGTETARGDFAERGTTVIDGPELELTDIRPYCARARFCHQGPGVWQATVDSHDPVAKDWAIEMANDCPAGRLVQRDKGTGETIEPELEPSIGVIEDPGRKEEGPLWVRGRIQVEGADGFPYQRRNRVTLCRCGRSELKPLCDGSHSEFRLPKKHLND